jgi:hemerythrin-like domain-containing protein
MAKAGGHFTQWVAQWQRPGFLSMARSLQRFRGNNGLGTLDVGDTAMAMNAIEMLKEDHEKVKKLLNELTDTTPKDERKREQLLEKIEQELLVHTKLEEEIFYPAFRAAGDEKHEVMFYEAVEEHRAVEKLVLPDLKKIKSASEKFSGRAKVLKELVEHHIEEEEEELFAKSEKSMDAETLDELGKQMRQRKKELKQEFAS